MSPTLAKIMDHWTALMPYEFVEFPFNVESFCREMDEEIALLKESVRELAVAADKAGAFEEEE